ncbi:alpha/beta hydrolase [Mumia sp. zg.B17]|uniref:alpha/beta fold hydrolase n=1 Tax=Mumia sp. zg.B17 TaxID=2855446 RepID=UPI001C6F2ACA|nr:alpha/beta hydrolase [Mumia sp. zg.B17]MBW9207561.1 alpha/beta hydrolase [Mumia sp. zg.B17]
MLARTDDLQHLTLVDQHVAFVDRDPRTGATPLVFLHGGAVDHRIWGPQLDAFPERRVLAPDARGHGWSSNATEARLCDDVVALLDALGIERAVLAGISMGGATAVDAALEHPDRVAGVVTVGVGTSEPVFEDAWALDVFAQWERAAAAGDAEAWLGAFMAFVAGPRRTRADVDPAVWDAVEAMASHTLAEQVVVDEHGVPVPPARPTGVTDTWSRLSGISVPVLAIAGAEDADDHRRMAERLVASVPHGELVMIEDAAHYPNLERPERFNRVLGDFLAAGGL